ncbi:MAG: outer membrane beta-barrel protein [bacterium]
MKKISFVIIIFITNFIALNAQDPQSPNSPGGKNDTLLNRDTIIIKQKQKVIVVDTLVERKTIVIYEDEEEKHLQERQLPVFSVGIFFSPMYPLENVEYNFRPTTDQVLEKSPWFSWSSGWQFKIGFNRISLETGLGYTRLNTYQSSSISNRVIDSVVYYEYINNPPETMDSMRHVYYFGNTIEESWCGNITYSVLDLPLVISYDLFDGKNLRGSIHTGINTGILLNATGMTIDYDNQFIFRELKNEKTGKISLGMLAGFQLDYLLGKHLFLSTRLAYFQEMQPLFENNFISYRSHSARFTAGIHYSF